MKAKMDNGHFVFSPRERGEEGDNPSQLCDGGDEGQPDSSCIKGPIAPLLPRCFAVGPLPLPSFEGRGQVGKVQGVNHA